MNSLNEEWLNFFNLSLNIEGENDDNNRKEIISVCDDIKSFFNPKKHGCRYLLLQENKTSIFVIRSSRRLTFSCYGCLFIENDELIKIAHSKLEKTNQIEEPFLKSDFKYAFWTIEAKLMCSDPSKKGCVKCGKKYQDLLETIKFNQLFNVLILANTKIYNRFHIFYMFIEEVCSVECLNKVQKGYKNMNKFFNNNIFVQSMPDYVKFESYARSICCFCKKDFKNIYMCKRCKKIRYCSKECQTTDWVNHKKNCQIKALINV